MIQRYRVIPGYFFESDMVFGNDEGCPLFCRSEDVAKLEAEKKELQHEKEGCERPQSPGLDRSDQ